MRTFSDPRWPGVTYRPDGTPEGAPPALPVFDCGEGCRMRPARALPRRHGDDTIVAAFGGFDRTFDYLHAKRLDAATGTRKGRGR